MEVSTFGRTDNIKELSKITNNTEVEVVRGRLQKQISIFDVVVGDVVCLKIGDQVPADGLFFAGKSMQVDESSMTSESDHIEVNSSGNLFLLSGTKVVPARALISWGLVYSLSQMITPLTIVRANFVKSSGSD